MTSKLLLRLVALVLLIALFFISCTPKDLQHENRVTPLPKVTSVYPTNDTLPENLLRFYVQFSQSMKAVNNLENIKLLDEEGKEIKGAIFNNVYELWDSEQTQLTLILDPARVKTGLKANERLGRALQANQSYQLVIEKAEDIQGRSIAQPFVKKFYTAKADRIIPNTNNWKINSPPPYSASPLQINFPDALDRISLLHRIQLLDENNSIVAGKVEISNQEKSWYFHPLNKWESGMYTLQVNSRLEDPSGNNLNGLFDHKTGSLKYKEEGRIIELDIMIK